MNHQTRSEPKRVWKRWEGPRERREGELILSALHAFTPASSASGGFAFHYDSFTSACEYIYSASKCGCGERR
eukprot:1349155-Amorphochlora_amoeboformis.AAC.1